MPEQRLWSRTDRTGPDFQGLGPCWRYTGSHVPDGYGAIVVEYQSIGAHRFAWELTHGAIPDGLMVLHKCDRRDCINPAHLFLGTHLDNMADMVAKDRAASDMLHGSYLHPERRPRGSANKSAKLTEQKVRDICQMRASGTSSKELAALFGVVSTTIDDIVSGRTWRHVE